MKYIHGGTIKDKSSSKGGAIVRIIFGFILLFFSIIFFLAGTIADIVVAMMMNFIFFWPGSFLLLFFGFRSVCRSTKELPRHNATVMPYTDLNNPFFTTKCERCGLAFDYQNSDLDFRPWYREGFVECPRCELPIRHNAITNVFQAEEIV